MFVKHLPCSIALSVLLWIAPLVLAAPNPTVSFGGRSFDLIRRARPKLNATEEAAWAQTIRLNLEAKYGYTSPDTLQRRTNGYNLITNQNADSSFFGTIAVGTPPVAYDVILDSGSSDLWLAANTASGEDDSDIPLGVAVYNPSQSSTYQNLDGAFSVDYGSGSAEGSLARETVQMAGFEVAGQVIGLVDEVTPHLLTAPVSGLIGLAWQQIASSGAKPFWQALAESSGTLDSPVMGFQLTRYLNDERARTLEPGGTFTLGAVNTTLFTGDIDYQSIPSGQVGFWLLEMTGLTAQSTSVPLPSGSASYAAIDTGTTLVGGPPDVISELYAAIPGSSPATGEWQGYYQYPCSPQVNVTLRFGSNGTAWPVSAEDFELRQLSDNMCVGSFFPLPAQGNSVSPPWIVGDTFLKNVYTVFRHTPPSVGFAQLSAAALAMNDAGGAIPSPTVGAVAAAVSGSGTSGVDQQDNAARRSIGGAWMARSVAGSVLVGTLVVII